MEQDSEFQRRMLAQCKKMIIDRCEEIIRTGVDPGEDFLMCWPFTHGEAFSKNWELSLCKTCEKCNHCGFEIKPECTFYIQIIKIEDNQGETT